MMSVLLVPRTSLPNLAAKARDVCEYGGATICQLASVQLHGAGWQFQGHDENSISSFPTRKQRTHSLRSLRLASSGSGVIWIRDDCLLSMRTPDAAGHVCTAAMKGIVSTRCAWQGNSPVSKQPVPNRLPQCLFFAAGRVVKVSNADALVSGHPCTSTQVRRRQRWHCTCFPWVCILNLLPPCPVSKGTTSVHRIHCMHTSCVHHAACRWSRDRSADSMPLHWQPLGLLSGLGGSRRMASLSGGAAARYHHRLLLTSGLDAILVIARYDGAPGQTSAMCFCVRVRPTSRARSAACHRGAYSLEREPYRTTFMWLKSAQCASRRNVSLLVLVPGFGFGRRDTRACACVVLALVALSLATKRQFTASHLRCAEAPFH
jgi:hypothetical protein